MTTTSETIAKRLADGDHGTYEQIFNDWYVPLCKYACTIVRDMDDAEDVVQKTFYKLWDQHKQLTIHTSIKSYLYRAVHNDCLNRIKQRKVHVKHNNTYNYSLPREHDNVSGSVTYNELERTTAATLAKLPPKCRRVFEMSRIEQCSYAEIAQELSISTNTVENHISKALKFLRQGLKDFLPILILFIIKQTR